MHTLQEALDDIAHVLGSTIHPWQRKSLESAHEVLRTALIQQEAEKPFEPDWVNYRQGYENGKADALEQQGDPVAYITETEKGDMVWTPEMYSEACTYCDDGEFPIPLFKSVHGIKEVK